MISLKDLHKAPTQGRLATFPRNWSKIESNTVILDIVNVKPRQVSDPPLLNMNQEVALL